MKNPESRHGNRPTFIMNEMKTQTESLKFEPEILTEELRRLREQLTVSERNNTIISRGIANYEYQLEAYKSELEEYKSELEDARRRLALTEPLYYSRFGRLIRLYYRTYDNRFIGSALRKARALLRHLRGGQ